ncbi:cytochrome c3 family protein [Cerasicoccus arenae]|nr:cytochrome c3 family protein [Cerasicoccus arenae]
MMHPWRLFSLIAVSLIVALFLGSCKPSPNRKVPAKPALNDRGGASSHLMPETHFPERLAMIGPQACAACHLDAVHDWEGTHHALANRPVDLTLDHTAFNPAWTFTDAGVTTRLSEQNGEFSISVDEADGSQSNHILAGVIAVDPLRQYLAPFANGQWQTTSSAYDPAKNEWFDVFTGEDRLPGEWGHWTGQGMNWNANCAACHMTEFKKNYDWQTGKYASTWLQQGIACAQCHTGLEAHMRDAGKSGYTVPESLKLSKAAVMDNCASCHSRRGQLTNDRFRPGERYHDHYELSLPDQPNLYYPDGQVLDEDFVYGSFMMSRMGHAGVSCLDCHNPHSLQTILPVENNLLCMRCHEVGLDNAPIIKAEAHSHHPAGSTGNRCVECHMPHTTYMQRDPRRDHGFTSPDPLMTQELGIPNACNSCHNTESTEWAVEWAEKWYGEQLASKPQRARARAVAAAYAGESTAPSALMELATMEDIPAWHAVYAGLLAPWGEDPAVYRYLREQLSANSPLVRSRAVRSLAESPADIFPLHKDDSRAVRLAVADALINRTQLPEQMIAEWFEYQQYNSDRPQHAFVLANYLINLQRSEEAVRILVDRAVALDALSAPAQQQGAVFYSRIGDTNAAEEALLRALQLEPQNVQSIYLFALLRAEQQNYPEAIALLRDVTALEPGFERAWFNLALAYSKIGQWGEADAALRGAPGMSNLPAWRQTFDVIQRQLGAVSSP